MFGKKKTKGEQPITPEELGRLNDKQTQNPTIRKYHVATDSAQIMGLKKRRKILGIILGAVTAVLAILFIISMLVTKWGDLVIEIDRPAVAKGFTLSESKDFESKSVSLSAKQALDVTNITYNWLPTDLDTSKDGEHNGENYVAYYINHVRCNIWIEGEDAEARLAMVGGKFTANLRLGLKN